jgi:alpha-N-acetylglucosamine transferase
MATLYDEADLKDIIMQCPDEDTKYEKPEKMYDSNGNKIYAYVTLIMLGDKYIPAALVLAKSIKDLGSEADLVVLVTDDVSADGKNALRKYYDQVIDIEYVKIANWRTKKQTTREYLNLVFTKFHVFNLTQYKKILLIDADALVLKHPDHLFSLNAPAGCYLKDKDLIIKYDKDGNYILPDNKKFAWYDKMCDCCGHGKLISKSDTDDIHKNFKNPGIGGGLMLLEPKAGELDNIIASVKHGYYRFLVERRLVWPEQQFLTLRYSGKWHGINPRFFGLQGYPHWRVLYGLQYGGDKPFLESSKMDISIRLQFPDYKLWHDMYRDILNENPEFNDIRTFEESIR